MKLDLRAAVRALIGAPAFAAGAVLTLAVALGLVTTAVGLLLGAVGRLGTGVATDPAVLYLTEQVNGRQQQMRWTYAAVEILRSRAASFDRIASYTTATLNFAGALADGERLDIELVSPHYLEIVGVAPAIGRPIAPVTNERVPGPDEILISDALWQRSFGGDASVLGRIVRLSRRPVTVVGVLPVGFRGLSGRADAIVPHSLAPVVSNPDYFTSDEYFHNVIARLAGGVSVEQARSELILLATAISAIVPPRDDAAVARSAEISMLRDAQTNPQAVRARILIAIGAIFVLLIAGVNVGNLVIARITARQREFAMRVAVGASRIRVFRAIAIEMALVTAAGLAAAFIAAVWARDLIATLIPATLATPSNDYGQFATFSDLRLDAPVVLIVAVLALLTMVVISVFACRPIFARTLADVLKLGGRVGLGPGRAERVLLTVQVAASIALLAAAGLLFRTVSALSNIDPGFDASNVIAFSLAEDLAAQRPDSGPALAERVLEGVGRVRGVVHSTVGQCTPYGARCARLPFHVEGDPRTEAAPPTVGWHRVGPNHFAALNIPVLRGRGFTSEDRRGRPSVVVINEEAAGRFFRDRDPIGQHVRLPQVVAGDPQIAEIVGVVGNVVYWPADEPPGPDVYQPALQFSYPWTTVMVRTAGDPIAAVPDLRQAIREVDPNLPLYDLVTLEDTGRAGRADRRFMSLLLAACAALGLLLAVIGVYAVTASWMAARRRELGLRVALGADPRRLVSLVMRTAVVQTVGGLIAGTLVALGAGRLLSTMLFGVDPHDPATLISAAAAMFAVSLAAAYVPARRALRVDPMRELNTE